jgi:hypothetical protein
MKALILALAISSTPVFAQAPPTIDFSKFPSESILIEDVVVPVPGEIFRVLDKLGKPKWREVQHASKGVAQPFGEPPQIALMLGVVIADGFVAVEAEDSQEVEQIGRSVLNLAKAIGVEKTVVSRSKSIIDSAGGKDWPAVRRELDGALKDVRTAMDDVNSQSLAQLVSLGGWLRGTEALATVVTTDFTADGAELLEQPLLLDHFDRRLSDLNPRQKASPGIAEIHRDVLKLRPLLRTEQGKAITQKSVKEIQTITAALIRNIRTKTL